jgi:hypothetical protein
LEPGIGFIADVTARIGSFFFVEEIKIVSQRI